MLMALLMVCLNVFMCLDSPSIAYADTARTMEVQRRLTEYGYYDGEINGYYDDLTVVAIKNFQADNGLNVTGAVDGSTASALGIYMSPQDHR